MVNDIIMLKQTNGWLNQAPDKESRCIKTVYIKNSARQNVRSKEEIEKYLPASLHSDPL